MPALEQKHAALNAGNKIRMDRAKFKRSVRQQDSSTGKRMVLEAICNPSREMESARVIELLLCVSRIGPHKAERILVQASMSPRRRCGELTKRERERLTWVIGNV